MKLSLLLIVAFIFYSCSLSNISYNDNDNKPEKEHNTEHTYKILAKDINDQPLTGT